ncbi:MAG: phosphatidylserine decarboxylase family protein [Rhizobiales bacterium]|nr:phosphatidylserine decarboxylase family protein [Hyphomicrobiales bacterium]
MNDERTLLERIADLFPPIHRDGHRFLALGFIATLVLFLLWSPAGWLAALATVWLALMFRDPDRVVPMREGLILAPADGILERIETLRPEPGLDIGADERIRLAIHLSPLDVHVQRAPVAGRIALTLYAPGRFGNVMAEKASEENEKRTTIIETTEGARVAVVQIAGGLRRRIVSFVTEGARIGAGERIGLIRLGSRVDLYLPVGAVPLVATGQRMFAGETVVADTRSQEGERSTRLV